MGAGVKQFLEHIDLRQNELQNAVIQNLLRPPLTPRPGQVFYGIDDVYDTKLFLWNGEWVDLTTDSILKLKDTPDSYTGKGGSAMFISPGEDAIDFRGITTIDISDYPDEIEAYITDSVVISLLEDDLNWNTESVYVGPGITNTYQGQKHYDSLYLYQAVEDNDWIRTVRKDNELETIPGYIADVVTQSLLENTANWDGSGVYIGVPVTDTYQGQKHYDSSYLFEAVDDNLWIRLIRG